MVNKCVVVNVLTLVGYGHAAHIGVGSFPRKGNAGCVARCSVMQCHVIQKKTAVGLLINKHIAYTHRVVMSFFKLIQIKLCVLAYVYLCNLCYQEVNGIHCMITNQQTCLCIVFKNDQQTAIHHEVNIATQYVYQLNGFINDYILGHVKHYTVLHKSSIESNSAIGGVIGQLRIIPFNNFGVLGRKVIQAAEHNSFGKV